MTTADMHRVITAGETMALMVPPGPGRLRHATSLALSIGVALEQLSTAGPAEVVLKLGADGCAAVIDGEQLTSPGFPARELDPIGAGDACDAGYLAATLWGWAPEKRLRTANAMGAFCVQNLGDYEGLPSRRELDAFLEQTPDLGR